MEYQEKEYEPSPYAKYITGELPLPENSGIMIKRGYLISAGKGMGSAYGGQWRPNPNKPNDMALKGTANTVRRIYTSTRKGGYWIQVKYGEEEQLKESDTMSNQDFIVLHYDDEAMRFKTISEFKNSLVNGGEIVIEWKDVEYGIFRERDRFFIGHGSPEENVYYDSPDELLEYRVGNDRLRDVITKVIVIDRTL